MHHRTSHALILVLAVPAFVHVGACAPCDKSIALLFPNEAARDATVHVRVEAHNPDTGGASAGARDCGDFIGLAKQGKEPVGSPREQDFKFPFSEDETLNQVPAGKQIIYVLAFASADPTAPAILEGCTDKFDSKGGKDQCSDVAVDLKTVLPDSARLVKVGGDHQVGVPGQMLAVPLTVRVEAESPASSGTYQIPGVPITFTTKDPDFALIGAKGSDLATVTGTTGEASANVNLPKMPKTGEIDATAPDLQDPMHPDRGTQSFNMSVTEEVNFPRATVIGGTSTGLIPIQAALGHVTSPTDIDLVILSCQGSIQTCIPGASARTPFGNTKLSVYSNLASAAPNPITVTPPANGMGILPAGLAVGDFVPPMGQDDIAILNSRRMECQSRTCTEGVPCACYGKAPGTPCACEGAEVLVFKASSGNIIFDWAPTLTASNAVGLTPIRTEGGHYLDLAVSAQGRTTNYRACSLVNRCLPYDSHECRTDPEMCSCNASNSCAPGGAVCAYGMNCICHEEADGGVVDGGADPCVERVMPQSYGCPPSERCECPGCDATQQTGVCIARDKIVDVLANRWNLTPVTAPPMCSPSAQNGMCASADEICQVGVCIKRSFFNRGGCNNPQVSCDNSNARQDSTCGCLDTYNENTCSQSDGCGCKVPDSIFIGDIDAPTLPFGITAGPLRTDVDWDIVVPAISGIELIEARPVQKTFGWKGEPTMNAPIQQALVLSLDSKTDDAPDVAWISNAACTLGDNFQSSCPIFRKAPPGTQTQGCIGVFYTDKQDNVFDLRPPEMGACRRYNLPFAPDGICSGHFNSDPYLDVAIASRESNQLFVLNGDGLGGLLDPPKAFMLPGNGMGGPVVCGDVDGDGKDDVIVINAHNGEAYVLRTGG
jgi:hypothetical protein